MHVVQLKLSTCVVPGAVHAGTQSCNGFALQLLVVSHPLA